MSSFRTGETTYQIEVPSTFVHEGAGEGKPLLLFTHGFADTGPSFLRRALPGLDPRFEILAPNGPFPMPQRVEGEWKDAYAWYVADLDANRIRVHPRVAARALAALVGRLGLSDRPKALVGFSQGGYFLPHLAHELQDVKLLLTVGAGVQPRFFEEYGLQRAPVFGIHGSDDEVIPFAESRESFRRLGPWNRGTFAAIPGMTHAINDDGRAALAAILSDWAGRGFA